MQIINIKHIIRLVVLFGVAELALASNLAAQALDNVQPPELPPVCNSLQVPSGHEEVSLRVYAVGVQIYRWNGASWDFVAPVANLYADANYRKEVGFHYAGPTWESNDGSKVVAARLAGCSPDPATAIPWLLLQSVSTEGFGIFRKVTYVQRVNTIGGLAPATPGAFIGAEARVPYTTEYYFYRGRRDN
jgi:hypothetical protein